MESNPQDTNLVYSSFMLNPYTGYVWTERVYVQDHYFKFLNGRFQNLIVVS